MAGRVAISIKCIDAGLSASEAKHQQVRCHAVEARQPEFSLTDMLKVVIHLASNVRSISLKLKVSRGHVASKTLNHVAKRKVARVNDC